MRMCYPYYPNSPGVLFVLIPKTESVSATNKKILYTLLLFLFCCWLYQLHHDFCVLIDMQTTGDHNDRERILLSNHVVRNRTGCRRIILLYKKQPPERSRIPGSIYLLGTSHFQNRLRLMFEWKSYGGLCWFR